MSVFEKTDVAATQKNIVDRNYMKKILIREQGLIGTLFQPKQEKLPAIILVPGSDGGIPEMFSEKLATEGYIVFALGYFGLTGLPEYLENIHLEYFQKAFQWLKKQHCVEEDRIAVCVSDFETKFDMN